MDALNALLRLTQTEKLIAETRRLQASTEPIERDARLGVLSSARPGRLSGEPGLASRRWGHFGEQDSKGRFMLWFIISLLIIGVIAGFVARLLVPGPDPMSVFATLVLGIVGSFIGGFLGYLIFGKDIDDGALQASGIIGSIIGAVIALLVYRFAVSRGRGRRLAR